MIAIADASPLIVLSKLELLNLLRPLYPELLISTQVRDELVTHGRGRAGAAEIAAAPWISVRSLQDSAALAPAASAFSLGLGEMSTILLGSELKADVLLMDERKARRVAKVLGLPVVGCAGLLERLYARGDITDLRAIFQKLASVSYIQLELLNARLRSFGLDPL